MIILVKDNDNKIVVDANPTIDVSGFTATLSVCGTVKTIADLGVARPAFEFTADESALAGNGTYGELIVYNRKGEVHSKYLPQFKAVPADEGFKADGNQTIVLTIVSRFEHSGAGGNYVTPAQMEKAIDKALDGLGQRILTEEKVDVVTPEGETVQRTAQESMEDVAVLQKQVQDAMETHAIVSIEDKDGDGQPDGELLRFTVSDER